MYSTIQFIDTITMLQFQDFFKTYPITLVTFLRPQPNTKQREERAHQKQAQPETCTSEKNSLTREL